jgi:OOP family OmpA-OmpF porin
MALISAAGVSHADDFFVSTSLGGSNYRSQPYVSLSDWHSQTEALRFGYQWTTGAFSYGLETGYANMGHSDRFWTHLTGSTNLSERIDGFMLGGNLKYALPMGFYVSARGGFFRSTNHEVSNSESWEFIIGGERVTHYTAKEDVSGMGSYAGVGVGYDINRSLGLGLNYDRYRAHVPYSQYGGPLTETSRVDTYTVTAEYRF